MSPENPFYVLELTPAATAGEVERQGRKLLGLLEIGSAKGLEYTCPLGAYDRDATMVREAMAALRDPRRRACAAASYALLAGAEAASPFGHGEIDAPLANAFDAAGLRGF